jgi:hypothetical protein
MKKGFMKMMSMSGSFKAFGGMLSLLVLGPAGAATAQEAHGIGMAEHGGVVARTPHHHFEVVFRKDGLAVYPSGTDGKPVASARLSGTATFFHPGSPRPWFARPLRVGATGAGAMAAPLGLDMDLGQVPTAGAKVTFQVAGLPDPAETTATFTVPFALGEAARLTFTKATAADQKAIAAQKVCPVSGESLGSMGTPVKATRGDRSIFLCCQSCLKTVQADPNKFLGTPAASPDAKGQPSR